MQNTSISIDGVLQTKWQMADTDRAVALASVATPYLHPKPTSALRAEEFSNMRDEALDEIYGHPRGRIGPADEAAESPD